MIDQFLDKIDPTIADALYGLIMLSLGSLGPIGLVIKKLLQTKQAQNSLHMALDTGVDWITDQIAELIAGNRKELSYNEVTEQIVDYVKGSVPDSVKRLKASDKQLLRMARARLNVRLSEMLPFNLGQSSNRH